MKFMSINVLAYYLFVVIQILTNEQFVTALNSPGVIPCSEKHPCKSDEICKNNKCVCDNKQACTSKIPTFRFAQKFVTCTDNDSCPGNLICNTTTSTCSCSPGYVKSLITENVCLKEMEYDGDCFEDKQCKYRNSECNSGKCKCLEGYFYTEKACFKRGSIGKLCTQSKDCEGIEGSKCNPDSKVCDCIESKILHKSKGKCIDIPTKPGDDCFNDEMCLFIKLQICLNDTCQCPKGHHINNAQTSCILDKHFGEKCQGDECYLFDKDRGKNALICYDNCICATDYILGGKEINRTCIYSGASHLFSLSSVFFYLVISFIIVAIII